LTLPPPDGRGEPIAFYPEGESGTSESLSEPLPGSGRFLAALARRGVPLLPVAFSERNDRLTATIGTAFVPSALQQGTAAEGSLDAAVAREAMARVASLMPRGRSDVVAEGLFRTRAAGRLRPSLGRWGRAQRLLPPPPARVLDCGCAFGYLTKELVRRYETYGIDLDPGYVTRARRAAPDADIRLGSASALPWEDSFFDAVVCLDVLEHCPDPRAVVTEMGRVLRPGGTLVLSVPHRGVLSWADSLNVYSRLLPKRDVPTDDPSWRERPFHAHFSARALAELLGPHFQVDRVLRTGIGVAEPINLGLLLATRGISRRLRPVYAVLQYLYFAAYIVEDMLPSGPAGYHLMVRARRMAEPTP
jgi:SAM-dependent methyltransferase